MEKIEISYDMDINDIKNKLFQRYMHIMMPYVHSNEYLKMRIKSILKFFIFIISVYLLIGGIFYLLAEKDIMVGIVADLFFGTAVNMFFGIMFFGSLTENIKEKYFNKFLREFSDLRWNNNLVYSEDDINKLTLPDEYNEVSPDDGFIGKYKNINYKLNEMEISYESRSDKHNYNYKNVIFRGFILKTNNKFQINNVAVISKNYAKKEKSIFRYLGFTLCISAFAIIVLMSVLCSFPDVYIYIQKNSEYILQYCWVVAIIILLINFAVAKFMKQKDIDKIRLWNSSIIKTGDNIIDSDFIVRTSDESIDVNQFITPEFAQLLLKVRSLFNGTGIQCVLEGSSLILAVDAKDNLFEIGNIFRSPLSKGVSEKIVSQFAGIMIFMDYIYKRYRVDAE